MVVVTELAQGVQTITTTNDFETKSWRKNVTHAFIIIAFSGRVTCPKKLANKRAPFVHEYLWHAKPSSTWTYCFQWESCLSKEIGISKHIFILYYKSDERQFRVSYIKFTSFPHFSNSKYWIEAILSWNNRERETIKQTSLRTAYNRLYVTQYNKNYILSTF